MNNKTGIAAIALTLLGGLIPTASHSQTLTSLGKTDISPQFNPAFYEVSGLGLSNGQNALWSISDGELKIYKMNLNGTSNESFTPTPVDTGSTVASVDFEGVTFAPPPAGNSDDHFIYVANEAVQAILPVNYSTQQYYAQARLVNMAGYRLRRLHGRRHGLRRDSAAQTPTAAWKGSPGTATQLLRDQGERAPG